MDANDLRENSDEQDEQDEQDESEEQDDLDEEEDEVHYTNKSESQKSPPQQPGTNVQPDADNKNKILPSPSSRLSKTTRGRKDAQTEMGPVPLPAPPAPPPPAPARSDAEQQSEETQRQPPNWKSANAFINFMQDFRKDNTERLMGRNVFQICGERWKGMTDEQKQPYIEAANMVKRMKQQSTGDAPAAAAVPSSSPVLPSKKNLGRVSKRKVESKRKESFQKRSKTAFARDLNSDSDSDMADSTMLLLMSDTDSS